MPLFYRNFNTKDDIVKQYVQNIFNEYKWNDKLDTTYQNMQQPVKRKNF